RAKAQQQLEDPLVKLAVEAAAAGVPGGVEPAEERGVLVVDEEAAILHLGLAQRVAAGKDVELGALLRRHVCPEVPGRDADLSGELVHAVDGAALVAAGDDQRAG